MHNENTEIRHAMERAAERLPDHVDLKEDAKTPLADAIADLLILAEESGENVGEIVTRGLAHFAATYMEPLDADEAQAWLESGPLFTLTGERQFPEYAADQAVVLSGHRGRVFTPEWGC